MIGGLKMDKVVRAIYWLILKNKISIKAMLSNPIGLSRNMGVSLDIAEFVDKYRVTK